MEPMSIEPVLGACHGGVRIGLAKGGSDPQQPFVVLHEGRFSRIHLAEVGVDRGAQLLRFALKVRSDAYGMRTKGAGRALTNVDVDDLWAREVTAHAALRVPHVASTVPVPPALLESPPLTYCSKIDRFFHPVCAVTGAVLSVCKDDELLASGGLLPYTQDCWRYLHGGRPDAPSRTFYRVPGANAERPRDGFVVRLGNQLFRDWGRLVHADPADPAATRAAEALPCMRCEHRSSCHPDAAASGRVPAEDHLRAVTFYDFRAIALELQDFDYDELCVLLGGGDVKDAQSLAASAGRRTLIAERARALGSGPQWLFASDPQRFPREVLHCKLSAFLDVCDGLRAVHTALDRPHLGVAPSNVMARLAEAGGAPARWCFRTSLIDLGSPLRVVTPAAGAASDPNDPSATLFEPGLEMREDLPARPFLAPDAAGQDDPSVALAVQFRREGGQAASGGTVRLVAEGQGAANLKRFRAGDVVELVPGGGQEGSLWARVEEVRARGFVAAATLPAGHACLAWDGRKLDCRATFHRHLGAPADLYGLGMLLFRTLLVNDEQGMDEIVAAVGKCLRRLADESGDTPDERQVQTRLRQLVTGKDLRARFEAANVLQSGGLREDYGAAAQSGSPPIDADLWEAVLGVGFKLVTRWRGFSYAHGDASPFVLKQVSADVDALRQRLHVDLFAAGEREEAIAAVCNETLEQLRAAMMSQPSLETTRAGRVEPAATPKGFRLVVQREGDPSPQEYTFDREQVTIGRREVENLVRLNDPMVSSAHALIELQPEGWVVIDRNSTNGTEVDGIRLPGDVPQPLQDGTVILIRPFRLTFHAGGENLDATSMVQTISVNRLREQLHSEYARCADAPRAQRLDALRKVLQDARAAVGSSELHGKLEEIARSSRAPRGGDDEQAQLQAKFFTSAHRSLAQLSRTLLGPGEFKTVEDVQAFAARLARFVETTSQWVERTLDLRRALGKHLEVGATSTAGGRSGARTAAEVRQLALGWSPGTPADPTGAFLGKFYDDVVGIIEGLLKGSQQVRRAVRERLDPQKLVEQAGKDAKLGGLAVNMAAGSALWKLYTQAFQEVTEGKQFELELDRLLQKSLQERAAGR